ncbi:MAG: hypothetical protein NTU53_13445 [Planctomycetota bacterium]|nr:hypothetical protein [Planctomycetota bacterium]
MGRARIAMSIPLLWAIATLTSSAPAQTRPADRIELKILYAGKPGSDREKDFVDFLARHFKVVKTAKAAGFADVQAEQFDVVILDNDSDKNPEPALTASYSRATITLGVAGAHICSERDLKTGYL